MVGSNDMLDCFLQSSKVLDRHFPWRRAQVQLPSLDSLQFLHLSEVFSAANLPQFQGHEAYLEWEVFDSSAVVLDEPFARVPLLQSLIVVHHSDGGGGATTCADKVRGERQKLPAISTMPLLRCNRKSLDVEDWTCPGFVDSQCAVQE